MNNLDRWAQYNYFWDVISPTLSIPERQVWLAIFRHANVSGAANVSRKRIADMLGVDVRTVSRGIAGLKEAKLIGKNKGGFGYALHVSTSDKNVTESDENVIVESDENVTDSDINDSMSDKNVPLNSDKNVTLPVTKMSHNTEIPYRTNIQNIITEHTQCGDGFELSDSPLIKKQPKQGKLPGTSKGDWKAKASSTFLFEALKMYPAHRRTYKPKEFQAIWDEAADEEGGHEVLWNMVREHLEKAVTSEDWTKEGGKYVPSMEKYIGKRKYRAPVVGAPEYGEEFNIGY